MILITTKNVPMRNLIFLFSIFFIGSCTGYSQQNTGKPISDTQAKVQVYFFHGTHRCSGCINAEKATVAVLNELYKEQQEQGIIKFQSINIEEPQNKSLAEKYQVAWNMLLFVPAGDETGKVELTEQAFAYGTNPEGLKPYIRATLDPMLK
jgi:hypothetical protein